MYTYVVTMMHRLMIAGLYCKNFMKLIQLSSSISSRLKAVRAGVKIIRAAPLKPETQYQRNCGYHAVNRIVPHVVQDMHEIAQYRCVILSLYHKAHNLLILPLNNTSFVGWIAMISSIRHGFTIKSTP